MRILRTTKFGHVVIDLRTRDVYTTPHVQLVLQPIVKEIGCDVKWVFNEMHIDYLLKKDEAQLTGGLRDTLKQLGCSVAAVSDDIAMARWVPE
jgi:hypothetical protein